MSGRIFRFAPSPNGFLHLGHALSALHNQHHAREASGALLLRIDDIDQGRTRDAFETAIFEDMDWLGIDFADDIRRQSEHLADYDQALQILKDEELVYPAFMSRKDIRDHIAEQEAQGTVWPRDPDGAPLYPGQDKQLSKIERNRRIADGASFNWRLDMDQALARIAGVVTWQEEGAGPEGETGNLVARPDQWGDVVLARRDAPAGYHLSVVIDDVVQEVSDVVRGRDLFHATALHRVLQELLGLPVPRYRHHRLVLGEDGRKLSKSRKDTAIRELRAGGLTPDDIARLVGLHSDFRP